MDRPSPEEVTEILRAAGAGDADAAEELLPIVYEELRGLAHKLMAHERPGQTLDPTALVHEAFLRLLGDQPIEWESRRHFVAAAARSMRRILVDRARRYARQRHGAGRQRLELDADLLQAPETHAEALVALDRSLDELEVVDRRKSEIVMLRYFAGMSVDDTAAALSIAPRTVKREWRFARAWLYAQMGAEPS